MDGHQRSMMDNLPHMMWSATPDGVLEYSNERWRTFTGRGDHDEGSRAWTDTVHPDDADALETSWQRHLAAGAPCEMECRVRRHDGEYRRVRFQATPELDEEGAPQRWFGTCTDVETTIGSSTAQKDEFLAMLGHELRNPLAPIVTALELMKLREVPDPFAREHAIIERQVQHLTALVNDMLDISRLTRGRLSLKRSPVALSEIVERGVDLASPLLEERRHRLHVDVPCNGCIVNGDVSRLSQVIANLLTNAAKFTAPNGQVEVRAQRTQDAQVRVRVIDNGRGIDPSRLDTIFEPFQQGCSQASDRAEGGIGLGLAIVRSIVELHDGQVSVESRLGGGSEFTVTLPLVRTVDDTVDLRVVEDDDSTPDEVRERILVVDDNHDAALTLTDYLDAVGYEVATAHDGPSALEIAREFKPSIGLLDIGLPLMDGYELATKLVNVPGLKDVRLIAVTGYGQPKDSARARQAGFHEHLVKPVDISELLRLLPSPIVSSK